MSEYADIIKLIDSEYETYIGTASQYIPRLRKALENEKKSKEEIKDRILNDCEKYWSRRTITDALGEDFKNVKQREAGQKGAEKKKQIAIQVSTDGQTSPSDDDNRAAMIAATKNKLNKVYPDIEEKDEDRQIEFNDLNTRIQMLEENDKRKSLALDRSYERIKELTDDKARLTAELEKKLSIRNVPDSNFTTASDIVNDIKIDSNNNNNNKEDDKENSGTVPVNFHKRVVGDLNTRILELKDRLVTKTFKETIEIRDQRIVVNVKCSNLESIEVDEFASRRLNQ